MGSIVTMNIVQKTNLWLRNIKSFAAFLGNLWGGMAVLTVVIPILNSFVHILPLESVENNGALKWFTTELFTAIAVIICFAMILAVYRQRNTFILQASMDRLHKLAWKSFGIGTTLLVIYLMFYYFLRSNIDQEILSKIPETSHLVAEALLLILYSGSFGMITRGLALLGAGEYLNQ